MLQLPWMRFSRLLAVAAIFAVSASIRAAGEKFVVYVGTIGGANRIYGFTLDADSGKMAPLGECATTTRPSYLAISADHQYLYATGGTTSNSRQPGIVRSFKIDPKTWKLAPLDLQPAQGSDPSYVSIDRTGKWLFNANYQNGSVSVYPIMKDGGIGACTDSIQYSGKGTNPSRQAGPHSHSIGVSPDNRFVFVCDLGLDDVFVYKFDAQNGKLTPNDPPFASVDPGTGARHFQILSWVQDLGGGHGYGFPLNAEQPYPGDAAGHKFVYVTGEIKSTVTVFVYDDARGELKQLQVVSMLPKDFTGTNAASELRIHPSGKWLYAANRGHDSIVRFSIVAFSGLLTAEDWTPTGGKTPRQFNIDPTGQWMLVGNQDSDSIQEFKIDPATGKLTATDQKFPVNHPSDFKFVPMP